MHSLRCSRWRHRCWEGAKLSRLRFQSASTALPWNEGDAGGCRGEAADIGKSQRDGQRGLAATDRGIENGDCTVRHVSFFLIIIFNPIHCTVQQFALTPTYEILQGSPSDESIRGTVDSSLLLILRRSRCESYAFRVRTNTFHNFFFFRLSRFSE